MRRITFLLYRVIYGLVLLLFMANIGERLYPNSALRGKDFVLIGGGAISLLLLLLLVLAFRRIPAPLFWVATVAWLPLFTWYAWFSQIAPFPGRELHTIDPAEAAAEISRHNYQAGLLFAVLCFWFVSLPFVRQAHQKHLRR